jgi:hypothetical protein
VLEALQLSAAQALAHPRAHGLLRCLMACRLATAPLSPAMQVGCARAAGLLATASATPPLGPQPLLLHRLQRNGGWRQPRRRCQRAAWPQTAPHVVCPLPQAWLAEQRRLVYEDSRRALLCGLPRCLAPLSPSLEQAGGLQRLALRGHTAPVTKVLLTPSGTDAVTGGRTLRGRRSLRCCSPAPNWPPCLWR